MAAGLGFKTFATGDVLTAADTNGYLMQGVWVFANATARDAAVTSPQEGNTCYLKDTDVIQVYSGSAWVTKSGAASPLTTKGDLWTYTTTDARLASSGVNNQVLTVDTSTASGLKWAAPVASGLTWTLLNSPSGTALTGAQDITISGISNRTNLLVVFESASSASASSDIKLRINGASTNYANWYTINTVAATYAANNFGVGGGTGSNAVDICKMSSNAGSETFGYVRLDGCTTNRVAYLFAGGGSANTGTTAEFRVGAGIYDGSAAVTSITLRSNTGNWDAGTLWVYGA